jgi:serine/threonine-protein kinase RsbW
MPSFSDIPPDRRLERDSTFESLEEIVDVAQHYAADVFADEDVAHRFVLAVSEAVANAIEHGNASDPEKRVVAEFRAAEARVEAQVTDEGGGFDPADVDSPLDKPNLARANGRGLYIIHQVADAVRYTNGGRQVHMVFRKASSGEEFGNEEEPGSNEEPGNEPAA